MPLPRLHLFEVEDQSWLPDWLRGYLTDYLRVLFGALVDRTSVVERLAEVARATGEMRILDLCSGSSGPLLPVLELLERQQGLEMTATLSDKYPNLEVWRRLEQQSGGRVGHHDGPVDARSVPCEAPGIRTLFAGLHHFRPEDARSILADAVRTRHGLAAFEVSERRLVTLAVLFLLPFAVWLTTPFLLPFGARRWLFTYLIPIIPLLVFWDGWVSCWRTYSPEELESLATEATMEAGAGSAGAEPFEAPPENGYRFRVGRDRIRGLPVRLTYILGYPDPDPDPTDPKLPRSHEAERPRAPREPALSTGEPS